MTRRLWILVAVCYVIVAVILAFIPWSQVIAGV